MLYSEYTMSNIRLNSELAPLIINKIKKVIIGSFFSFKGEFALNYRIQVYSSLPSKPADKMVCLFILYFDISVQNLLSSPMKINMPSQSSIENAIDTAYVSEGQQKAPAYKLSWS